MSTLAPPETSTVQELEAVRAKFPAGSILPQDGLDQPTWIVSREVLAAVARELRDNSQTQFDLMLDLCGVDFPDREERFEAVYHLYSLHRAARLRLKVPLREDDAVIPSLIPVWKAANWFERELWDMFGITVEGHPNLSRILTHEAFQGHPLRKDYDPARRWILTEDQIYKPHFDLPQGGEDEMFERMTVNIGPTHPAMHGTFRLMAVLDGETIVASDVEIGYLHRCFEKMSETHTWQHVIPYTDRLNYCSSFINNVGYCKTVEKLLKVEPPPKAVWARTILSEFSRVMDHCVCNGSTLVDAGALTNFWYLFQPREEIYGLLESVCGARLTVSACRIGGLIQDLPPDFEAHCRRLLEIIPPFIADTETLVNKNRIWHDRSVGIAALSGEEAVNWGWTGPCLRASGVGYDVRRAHPYDLYDTVDWEVPVLYGGDVYDRFRIRMMEIRESLKIIRQLLDRGMPAGPHIVDDPHVALPSKEACYNEMEAMIYHFKLIMDGIRVPEGEIYSMVEGANGELGFYTISDGTGKPYRNHCRPPCFPIFSTFSQLIKGGSLSDAIVSLGGLNIVAGEAREMTQPIAQSPTRPVLRPDAPYPNAVKPYKPGLAERLYLPLLGGLMVTARHFLRNLFGKKMYTIEYPEERRAYSHRFRGHHILTTRPDGSVRCVACFLCAQNCPAECIHIEAAEHPDVNIEKYPVVYEIDMLRCVFCGYCVDACPEEAIIMSNNYDMAYFTREQSIVGKNDLMKPYTFDESRLGYRPLFPEEDAQRARMRRDAFNLVEAARQAQERETAKAAGRGAA